MRHSVIVYATLVFLSFATIQDAKGNETNRTSSSFEVDKQEVTSLNPKSSQDLVAQNIDLTGRWRGDDGGIYYINQVEDEVFWFGESSDQISWTNVYHGCISGDRIIGSWSDVPKGNVRQAGEMDIRIITPRRLESTRKTGGFGGSLWTR